MYWRKRGLNVMGNIVYSSYYVLIILEVRVDMLKVQFHTIPLDDDQYFQNIFEIP